eukprot:Opistho-1_new@72019
MDAAGNAAASQRISVTVTDIDECAIPNPAIYPSCHPQAICRNTQGSYTCTCATGFTGDGIRSCVDTTAPTISLLGQSTVTITQAISWLPANAYVDAGATASDNFDGTITNKIVRSGSVDVRTVGTYRINFDVSDAAGNAATRVTRTVIVQDVNECDTARLTYDGTKNTPAGCDQYTTCVNNVGSYSCTPCPAGFTGTGQTSCKSISCQYSTYWSDCQGASSRIIHVAPLSSTFVVLPFLPCCRKTTTVPVCLTLTSVIPPRSLWAAVVQLWRLSHQPRGLQRPRGRAPRRRQVVRLRLHWLPARVPHCHERALQLRVPGVLVVQLRHRRPRPLERLVRPHVLGRRRAHQPGEFALPLSGCTSRIASCRTFA